MYFFKNKLWRLCASYLAIAALHTSAFAEACDFDGKWTMQGGTWTLHQEGFHVTGGPDAGWSVCGILNVDGMTDGITYTLQGHFINGSMSCPDVHITGVFDDSCLIAQMTFQDGVRAYTLPLQRLLLGAIKITSPDPNTELVINTDPKMPEMNLTAEYHDLPSKPGMIMGIPKYTWHINVEHVLTPGKVTTKQLDEGTISGEYTLNPSKLDGLYGGKMTVKVEYFQRLSDTKTYTIKGQNPGKTAIDRVLDIPVLRHIACQESRYRQFEANMDGGIGFPVVGKDERGDPVGGVGIMQVLLPKNLPDAAWNWYYNLVEGISLFEAKRNEARDIFRTELTRLNKERKKIHLSACPPGVISELTPEQLDREILRRYNGGREYRWEPRNAPNCEGHWVIAPTCISEHINGCDADYVDKVLRCNI